MKIRAQIILLLVLLIAYAAGAQTTPVVVQSTTSCATSVDGSVVGVLNPLQAPVLAPIYSGSLPAATYYVEIAWYDAAGHVTLASPEVSQILSATGSLEVNPPASGMPSTAAGMRVYIGTTSGGETLQGSTTGSAAYTQSAALAAGAALPTQNTTVCQQIANDAGWPTGTGYNVSLIDQNGNALPGYPMQWQLLGPGTTENLNQGLPLYNGTVTYPVPILARPYNHAGQSIAGPLSMTGYNLTQVGRLGVGTAVPGWGIDAEALPNNTAIGMINASNGFLVNGGAGTAGQCLGSDGTTFSTPVNCVTSVPTSYYQTVEANGVAQTQRSALNFSSLFTFSDSPSPSRTNVGLNVAGTDAKLPTTAASGIAGNAVVWDANGGISDAGAPPLLTTSHQIQAEWSGTSCTLGDDGTGGSGCQTTQSWGVTITGTYHLWCNIGYLSVACGNLGDCSGVIFNEESHTSTSFTYILNQRLNNGRGSTVPMTCFAAN